MFWLVYAISFYITVYFWSDFTIMVTCYIIWLRWILVTSNVLDHVSLLLCSVIAQTYHGRLMYLMKGTSETRRAYLTIYIYFYYTCFMPYLGYCAGLCIVASNTYCVFVSPFYVLAVSLDCEFFIVPLVFSTVYLSWF